ncbi:MAG TPA: ferritin-like domain-containing protein [Thermomicrobiaceae bacterium]|nr:ferritin-like domain-containing protein [Thermomicrobiaceae bacterium]
MPRFDAMFTTRISRRSLVRGAGALGLGLAASQLLDFSTAPLLRAAAAGSESLQDIVNIAATAEQLAVTLLGGAVSQAMTGKYNRPIPDPVLSILQAARAEEQYHFEYLKAAGAQPLTSTFTIPDPALLTDYNTLFSTIVALEEAFIAAYTAAAAEFAQMNHPELVKVALQIASVEGEHRVLANYALGTRPANDLAFEYNRFATVGDAAAALQKLGFIGGSGQSVSYPGPGGIDSSMVQNTQPGGPSVSCVAPGSSGSAANPSTGAVYLPKAPKSNTPGSRYFDVTGHNLGGGFRAYWEKFGGLPIFGYPITEEMQENGLTVQYFERTRFEWHPGAWPDHYDVLLTLLGSWQAQRNGLTNTEPFKPVADNHQGVYFKETGHNVSGDFLNYWMEFGDLAVYGYPLSEPYTDQQTGLTVQYFQRQRFEWHPGAWPERFNVLLGLLGDEYLQSKRS